MFEWVLARHRSDKIFGLRLEPDICRNQPSLLIQLRQERHSFDFEPVSLLTELKRKNYAVLQRCGS